jgi:hypothetical protein
MSAVRCWVKVCERVSNSSAEFIDLIGGGGRTRTHDLRIMSCPAATEDKADQLLS